MTGPYFPQQRCDYLSSRQTWVSLWLTLMSTEKKVLILSMCVYVCVLPFVLWRDSSSFVGSASSPVSKHFPTSSWKLLAHTLSKPAAFLLAQRLRSHHVIATVPSSGPGPQPTLLALSPGREQELETSTLTPKIVFFFLKKSWRTCVYWQFINKHQPPCKLFTKECSEVKKCEYK